MSSVAQAALGTGYIVSGSERLRSDSETVVKLKNAGVLLFDQDGSGITDDLAGVVISTAIEDDNPDLVAARALDVPVLHRSDMLARLIKGKRCLAVSGTSGKSTVTGMIGWVLVELGADPTVVNGAPVVNWMDDEHIGNVRIGKSDLWVIEADESDRSLLNYFPDWALITNLSADHFSLPETVELFEEFRGHVSDWVLDETDVESFSDVNIPVPGDHNVENAAMVLTAARKLGYDADDAAKALEKFRGISRRFEVVGSCGGVTVIDDYAHNPAKIGAAFKTARQEYGSVTALWRPHGYGPLVKMMDDMAKMFVANCSETDRVLIMPVYDAGGTADRSINSDELVRRLVEMGVNAQYVEEGDVVLSAVDQPSDAVLVLGARDPGLPELAKEILAGLRI